MDAQKSDRLKLFGITLTGGDTPRPRRLWRCLGW